MSSSHDEPASMFASDLDLPGADSAAPSAETQDRAPGGSPRDYPTIGPFRAVEILGRGAMGVVYLAEQTSPIRRRVALKVIRAGMASKEVIARFERERQALALMDHSNIARVFDAGESEGRPYFAMEYVPGVPITKFCDQHKLPLRRRLELFADVCDAVEHAHQKGLIHRDIKPSNILGHGPEDHPLVKVIDFGIAKSIGAALYDDAFHTQTGQFVGTPAYMSPEQAGFDHQEIDTRTDVYSLGVVLYELLVGVPPYDFRELVQRTLAQVQRFIVEKEPIAPSTRLSRLGNEALAIAAQRRTDRLHLQREFRGDLDCLLLKALEKDRNRRYRSAFDLAADLRHYLACEPLSAGRPTLLYRAAKFVRRRRRAIAAYGLSASLCIAAAAAGASIWRARGLARDAMRGEYLEAQIEASRNPQDAIERLTRLSAEHPEYVDARVALAYILYRENDIEKSIHAAEDLLADAPTNGPAHLLLSMVYRHRDPALAEKHFRLGREAVIDDRYYIALSLPSSDSAEAVSILSELLAEQGTHFDARWARAWRYFELGDFENMLRDANYLIEGHRDSATAWNARGVALNGLERLDEAIESFSQALMRKPNHAPTYINRAVAYFTREGYPSALADCEAAIAHEPGFAEGYAYRALTHLAMGQPQKATADIEYALARQPRNATARWVRARLLRQQGDLSGAAAQMDEALDIQPQNATFLYDRAVIHAALRDYDAAYADYTTAFRRAETADALHGRAIAASRLGAWDVALADFNRAIELDPNRAHYFGSRARLYRWMGDYARALADNDKAVELAPASADPYASRGVSRWLSGDLPGAVEDIEKAMSLDARRAAGLNLWLWQIHRSRGDAALASAALTRAEDLMQDSWAGQVISLLRGAETEDQLLESAVDDAKRCDAYYYLGAKAYDQGRYGDARRWFQECVRLAGSKQYTEYDLALGFLALLQ